MSKRILIIANATAGTRRASRNLLGIVERLSTLGAVSTICPINPAHGLVSRTFLAEHSKAFDSCLVLGGDGTLHHVLADMTELGISLSVAYVPSGSTNDFARTLGIVGKSPLDLAEAAVHGTPTPCDLGLFNGKPFLYIAAFGAFTKTSWATSQTLKNRCGRLAYVLSGGLHAREELGHACHMTVRAEGHPEISGEFIYGAVSNSVSTGGFALPLLRQSRIGDGRFEVLLVRRPKGAAKLAGLVRSLMRGEVNDNIVFLQSSSVHFTCRQGNDRDVPWTLDGESGGVVRDASIDVLSQKATLLL